MKRWDTIGMPLIDNITSQSFVINFSLSECSKLSLLPCLGAVWLNAPKRHDKREIHLLPVMLKQTFNEFTSLLMSQGHKLNRNRLFLYCTFVITPHWQCCLQLCNACGLWHDLGLISISAALHLYGCFDFTPIRKQTVATLWNKAPAGMNYNGLSPAKSNLKVTKVWIW